MTRSVKQARKGKSKGGGKGPAKGKGGQHKTLKTSVQKLKESADRRSGGGARREKTVHRESKTDVDIEKSYRFSCQHGPALFFIRTQHKKRTCFYACALCRNRKLCPFYMRADEEGNVDKRHATTHELKPMLIDHGAVYAKTVALREGGTALYYSPSRNEVYNNDAKKKSESDIGPLTTAHLNAPTRILPPLTVDEKEGQYWFSDAIVKTLLGHVDRCGATSVLCVGTPRLFESLRPVANVKTFLLDADLRFAHFISPKSFTPYNMFSHHFYSGEGESQLRKFVAKADRLLVVCDPPFGGMLAPLARSFDIIQQLHADAHKSDEAASFNTMLFMPYFLAPKITSSLPSLRLTDMTCGYENHSKFGKDNSVVRLFTDVDDKHIVLKQGYRLCKECNRYVSLKNFHCLQCGACTSVDLRHEYVHCAACRRCVKPDMRHCGKCNSCHVGKTGAKCAKKVKEEAKGEEGESDDEGDDVTAEEIKMEDEESDDEE